MADVIVKQEMFTNAGFPDAVQMVLDGIEKQFGAMWEFRWEFDPNDTPDDGIFLVRYSWRVGGTDKKPKRVRYAFTVRAVEEG